MLSFDNTEIAFGSKSDADLKRARRLFKLISSPALTKAGKWATNLALHIGLPVKGIIRKTIFRQFCGGETIEDCRPTVERLGKYGIGTILDYSVEGKTSDADFEHTVQEIIATIHAGKQNRDIPFAVFKMTGITRFELLHKANDGTENLSESEQAEYALFRDRVLRICQAAFECEVPVFVDAEESWIQHAIDNLAHEMMMRFNRKKALVYNTVQMYRHDRFEFLREQVTRAKQQGWIYGVKLVRGAYMEKERKRAEELGYPSPIQKDKASTDSDYNDALAFCLEHLDHTALVAGTHNEHSSALLAEFMTEQNIDKDHPHIYFAQLLGMSDHISYNLAHEHFNVAKYVPYGPIREVMPYLFRRADENTSVAGQTNRELRLLDYEILRRKKDR